MKPVSVARSGAARSGAAPSKRDGVRVQAWTGAVVDAKRSHQQRLLETSDVTWTATKNGDVAALEEWWNDGEESESAKQKRLEKAGAQGTTLIHIAIINYKPLPLPPPRPALSDATVNIVSAASSSAAAAATPSPSSFSSSSSPTDSLSFGDIEANPHVQVASWLVRHHPPLLLTTVKSPTSEPSQYEGENALHFAIAKQDPRLVMWLLECCCQNHGARASLLSGHAVGLFFRPSGHAYYGEFPISFAVCMNQVQLVRYLLERWGDLIDLSRGDANGNTAAHMCAYYGLYGMYCILAELWERGSGRPSQWSQVPLGWICNREGSAPLVLAAKMNRIDMFRNMWETDGAKTLWTWGNITCHLFPLDLIDYTPCRVLLPAATAAAAAAAASGGGGGREQVTTPTGTTTTTLSGARRNSLTGGGWLSGAEKRSASVNPTTTITASTSLSQSLPSTPSSGNETAPTTTTITKSASMKLSAAAGASPTLGATPQSSSLSPTFGATPQSSSFSLPFTAEERVYKEGGEEEGGEEEEGGGQTKQSDGKGEEGEGGGEGKGVFIPPLSLSTPSTTASSSTTAAPLSPNATKPVVPEAVAITPREMQRRQLAQRALNETPSGCVAWCSSACRRSAHLKPVVSAGDSTLSGPPVLSPHVTTIMDVACHDSNEGIIASEHVLRLLDLKWNVVYKSLFKLEIALDVIFLVAFMVMAIERSAMPQDRMAFHCPEDLPASANCAATVGLEAFILVATLLRIIALIYNWVFNSKLGVIHRGAMGIKYRICALREVVIIAAFISEGVTGSQHTSRHFWASAAVLSWSQAIFHLLIFEIAGPFVVVLSEMVTKDILPIIFILLLIYAGFVQGFIFLADPDEGEYGGAEGIPLFRYVMRTLLVWIIAPEFFDVESDEVYLFWSFMFHFIITVIIFSLLIALLNETFLKIMATSKARWDLERARIVMNYELAVLPEWFILRPSICYWTDIEGQPFLKFEDVNEKGYTSEARNAQVMEALADIKAKRRRHETWVAPIA